MCGVQHPKAAQGSHRRLRQIGASWTRAADSVPSGSGLGGRRELRAAGSCRVHAGGGRLLKLAEGLLGAAGTGHELPKEASDGSSGKNRANTLLKQGLARHRCDSSAGAGAVARRPPPVCGRRTARHRCDPGDPAQRKAHRRAGR